VDSALAMADIGDAAFVHIGIYAVVGRTRRC
jgi:hypothetical protein